MGARCFESAQALSDHQAERELQEALRVQGMTPAARWLWLQATWGRLQGDATFLGSDQQSMPGTARCYATWEEKNRFDEARELKKALQMPIHMAHRS